MMLTVSNMRMMHVEQMYHMTTTSNCNNIAVIFF